MISTPETRRGVAIAHAAMMLHSAARDDPDDPTIAHMAVALVDDVEKALTAERPPGIPRPPP